MGRETHEKSPKEWLMTHRKRFERICVRYAAVIDNLRRLDYEAYRRLVGSRSMETDPHVARLLVDSNVSVAEFLDDAWLAVRWIWTNFVHIAGRDDEPSLSFAAVVRAIPMDLADGERLSKTKQQLADRVSTFSPGARACAILGCARSGDALSLNSLRYCDEHYGLALFNGMRHGYEEYDCNACKIFNALALRNTLSDRAHLWHAVHVIHLPSSSIGVDTRTLNDDTTRVRVVVFTTGETPTDPLRWHEGSDLTYRGKGGSHRRVPSGSFVHMSNGGRVIAWLRVHERDIQTGQWIPVVSIKRLISLEESVRTGRLNISWDGRVVYLNVNRTPPSSEDEWMGEDGWTFTTT